MANYQRLKDLREDLDLDQKEIAKVLGISTNQYGRYERGENDIRFEYIIKLAEYYDVSIDYIAGRTNYKNGKDGLSPEEKNVLQVYNDLTDTEIGELRYHIKQLYSERKKNTRIA